MADIKQLKDEVTQLPNIEQLADHFERQWLKPIKTNTNPSHSFLINLPDEKKKELNQQLKVLKRSLREIKYGQVVNDKLASLAHNLVQLKIAGLTDDKNKIKQLLNMFLNDRHLSIKQLIFEVPYLESQISLFHRSYNGLLEQLSTQLPLEHSVSLLEGDHSSTVRKLAAVPQKQKHYLSEIGKHFVGLTREIKKKKHGKANR